MGLFDKLFGKPDHSEGILREGFALATEIERVYRNQLESIPPTGIGLYKARLLSATFALAAYKIGRCSKCQEDLLQFINQCSGIAFAPFAQPHANPSFSKEFAASFSGNFMTMVFNLIQSELTDGPSNLDRRTTAFFQLMEVYHHCLAESIGEARYQTQKQERALEVESIIWSHLRFLENLLGRLAK